MPSLDQLAADPRVTVRRAGVPDPDGRCVVYWMQRTQRGQDNPALDVAIHAANELGLPVVVFFGLMRYPGGNFRHYRFLAEGLADLGDALRRRRVGLVVRRAPDHRLLPFVTEVRAALVVGDENPLREPESWRRRVAEESRAPVWTVDADVIVPTALLQKEQYAAYVIRPRLHAQLERFLVREREPEARHAWRGPAGLAADARVLDGFPAWSLGSWAVPPVRGFRGGSREGLARLRRFVREGLVGYHVRRNRPELDATSHLSPYLHFGQLGPRQIALAVRSADAPAADRAAFLEELIVRRELAINFVRYNPAYDRLDGCERWARETLARHRRDRRLRIGEHRLEAGESPDPLWNAAQKQMVAEGWMHGYLRMYWAKKLLEWSESPEEALERAIALNDRYQLDGRDPNGYAGIAWAIGGKHDRAFGEREIFGKVRYMSLRSTTRKLDLAAIEARHG